MPLMRGRRSLVLRRTARIPVGRVVFASGPQRIYSGLSVGDTVSASSPVVTLSSTQRVATVSLTVQQASIVTLNEHPVVSLPSGASVTGRVATISTVTSSSSNSTSSSGSGSSSSSTTTVNVTVNLPNAAALANLTTAPVTVAFTQQVASSVLSVPSAALVTLADGRYAVEVAEPSHQTEYVVVTPGQSVVGGFVQITGDVRAGEQVVVPSE